MMVFSSVCITLILPVNIITKNKCIKVLSLVSMTLIDLYAFILLLTIFCFFYTAEYFIIMIIWVGMCVVLSAWILHIYHQDTNCAPMKPWLRILIFVYMARIVGMKKDFLTTKVDTSDFQLLENGVHQTDNLTENQTANQQDDNDSNGRFAGSNELEEELHAIKKYLLAQKENERKQELQQVTLQEWRNAAKIVDMFLFWLYSISTILFALFYTIRSVVSAGSNIEKEHFI